jgi:hypothetical protein
MGLLDDIMKTLDRWEVWREIQALPEKWLALEKRVADTEEKLGSKWPPDVCKFCGERAARLIWAEPGHSKGYKREDWRCAKCSATEMRSVKIK